MTLLAIFIAGQLGYGTLIGVGIGLAGGWLLGVAHRRKWTAHSWQQLGVVALPAFCAVASEAVGASMFIAAFVAGLAVQVGFKEAGEHSVEFTEEWGQLLNLSVFFIFGLLVARDWQHFTAALVLYAVLSLTVVPGIELYSRKIRTLPSSALELEGVPEKLVGENAIGVIQTKH
jgi:NhaP-type Na+/H+ or K+/H+ antiporter